MAKLENQGLLIAVIGLVILSLLLALGTFLGFSKMGEYADNMAAAEKKLNLSNRLNQANQIKSNILQTMVGEAELSVSEIDTQIDTLRGLSSGLSDESEREQVREIERQVMALKDRFDLSVKAYSSARDDDDDRETTYRSMIDGLTTSLAKMHSEYTIKDRQRLLAESEKRQLEESLTARIDSLQTEVSTLEQTLTDEQEASRREKQALQVSLDKNLVELQTAQRNHEQARSSLQSRLVGVSDNNKELQENNELLKSRINEITKEVFDRPDGEIVKIFSQANVTYIDLGRVHGLTEGQSFAVYDRSISNFEKGRNKASIEVTEVMENQAEARITMEDPENPILPGDWVLTPTWEPGQKVRFALAGIFDLDGDGESDMDRLIQMIRRQGGEVVVWHNEFGEIQGKIDPNVRFLVLGDSPGLGVRANPGVMAAMSELKRTAEANTVQVIDFPRLLQRMGIRSQEKVEVFSRGGTNGFQPRTPGGTLKSADN
jgi:hypothetical protein